MRLTSGLDTVYAQRYQSAPASADSLIMTDSSPEFSDRAQRNANRARAEAHFVATLSAIKGPLGVAASDAWRSEDVRMARFDAALEEAGMLTGAAVPGTPPNAPLRTLQRIKWRIGRSRLGPMLRPLYDRVVRRSG